MKKIIIVASSLLILAALTLSAVPALAAGGSDTPCPPTAEQVGKGRLARRFLGIQDEAKVDELLARALEAGRITPEQAERIKTAWENNHERVGRRMVLGGLMGVQDEAKVDDILAQAVANGKITDDQAARIKQAWENRHGS